MGASSKETSWEYIPPSVADEAELERRLGRFNDTPPGWKGISESEWAHLFGSGAAARRDEFRQIKLPDPRSGRVVTTDVHMWIFPDWSGVALALHHDTGAVRAGEEPYCLGFFRFSLCKHDYETIEQHMCYWSGRCRLCGHTSTIDSSD